MAYKNKSKKTQYQNGYIARTYDRVNLLIPKGRKAVIQAAAQEIGESTNEFINRLITAELKRLSGFPDWIYPNGQNCRCNLYLQLKTVIDFAGTV